MATCQTCGNTYDKTFQIVMDETTHVFDSFECAIHALAPRCQRCGCRILGHGVEVERSFYCGAHCANEAGAEGVRDRA